MAQVELAVARTSHDKVIDKDPPDQFPGYPGDPGGQLGWRTHGDVNNLTTTTVHNLRISKNL